jgi:hypothetical protein
MQKQEHPDAGLKDYVRKMFDILWEWATRPRTDEELQAIIVMRCCCSSGTRLTPEHISACKAPIETRSALGWSLVNACLFSGGRVGAPGTMPLSKLQPRSIHGLLPHGSALTVQGVCQWMTCKTTAHDRVEIFSSLHRLMIVSAPLVLPHMIVNRAFFEGIDTLLPPMSLSRGTFQAREEEELAITINECMVLVNVIYSLVCDFEANETMRKVFHHAGAEKLLGAYSRSDNAIVRANDTIREMDADGRRRLQNTVQHPILVVVDQLQSLKHKIGLLTQMFYMDNTTLKQYDDPDKRHLFSPTITQRFSLELIYLRQSFQRCCAPMCVQTVIEVRLKACLGCYNVCYCSRSCQKRAWNHGNVGHRLWCQALVSVQTAIKSCPPVIDQQGKSTAGTSGRPKSGVARVALRRP